MSRSVTLQARTPGGGGGGPPPFVYPFAGASAFAVPIPSSGAPVHASSQTILAACNWQPANTGFKWLRPSLRASTFFGDLSTLPGVPVYLTFPSCAASPKYSAAPMPSGWDTILAAMQADHIAMLWDTASGDYYEAWRVSGPGTANYAVSGGAAAGACNSARWNAGIINKWAGAAYDPGQPGGNGVSPTGFLVSGVSGANIMLGDSLLYPADFDDLSDTSIIPHAIKIDHFCGSDGSTYPIAVAPARSGDGKQSVGIPMGARVRLKPSIDVNNWPSVNSSYPNDPYNSAIKKILRTMQVYGCIGVDSTGAIGAGSFEACYTDALHSIPGLGSYVYPWEDPASNYGWSYGAGVPWDLMAPTHWDIIDWNVWTGA